MVDPRWRTVLTVAPYAVVAALAGFTVAVDWDRWDLLAPILVLCAVFAAWVAVLRDLPAPWRGGRVATVLLMGGVIVLNFALVQLASWFGFLAIATFTLAYSVVGWPWELLAVAATSVVAGWAQGSSIGTDPAGVAEKIAIIVLNITIMGGLSWGLHLTRRTLSITATELERSRIAREIHDTLAQNFTGIVTQLQAAELATNETTRRHHTDSALALARDGLAEARRSVRALRPAELEATRLPEALQNVARRWSARTGIPVTVRTSGSGHALGLDAEVALLRTAQETLANVERHAGAHRVELTLRSDAAGARLEVRDDGRGFDPRQRQGRTDGGYGLVAMRERIESVAGALVIESRPGHGTAVRAEVPA